MATFNIAVFSTPAVREEGVAQGIAEAQSAFAMRRIARLVRETGEMSFRAAIAPEGKIGKSPHQIESTGDDEDWCAIGTFVVRDVLMSDARLALLAEKEADEAGDDAFPGRTAKARAAARAEWIADRVTELEVEREIVLNVIENDREVPAEDKLVWQKWSGDIASRTAWLRNEVWRREDYPSFVMLSRGTGHATDRERGLFVNDPANKALVAKYAAAPGAKGGKGSKGGKVNGKRAKTGLQITKDQTTPVDVLRLVSQLWGDDFEALGGPLDAVIDALIAERDEKAAK